MDKAAKSAGHRQRLRTRFLKAGLDGFLDYEIIELLLTLNTPRKDCKQIAKEAIKKEPLLMIPIMQKKLV